VFPLKDNIPTDRLPLLTLLLIAVNIFVYFFLQKGGFSVHNDLQTVTYGAVPYELTHPESKCIVDASQILCREGLTGSGPNSYLTVFSSMFMHGSVLHLGGNMLFLWIFGNNIEDSMGRVKFTVFYLLGGVTALALQVAVEPNSLAPTIGASGAVAAVLGGYILLFPRAKVMTVIFIVFFFTVLELPALLMIGLWIVQQVIYGLLNFGSTPGESDGVAYFAHIGGFLFGLLAIKLFAQRSRYLEKEAY